MTRQRVHAQFAFTFDEIPSGWKDLGHNSQVTLRVELRFDGGGRVKVSVPETVLPPIFRAMHALCAEGKCNIPLGLGADDPTVDIYMVWDEADRVDANVAIHSATLGTLRGDPKLRGRDLLAHLEDVQGKLWELGEEPAEVRGILRVSLNRTVDAVEVSGPGSEDVLVGDVVFQLRTVNVWTRPDEWRIALGDLGDRIREQIHTEQREESRLLRDIDAGLEELDRQIKARWSPHG